MAQLVGDAGYERRLRPDDDEVGAERAGEREQALAVLRPHGVAAADGRDTGIAGRRVQLVETRRLGQLPRERVLASAGADQQHFHTRTLTRSLGGV